LTKQNRQGTEAEANEWVPSFLSCIKNWRKRATQQLSMPSKAVKVNAAKSKKEDQSKKKHHKKAKPATKHGGAGGGGGGGGGKVRRGFLFRWVASSWLVLISFVATFFSCPFAVPVQTADSSNPAYTYKACQAVQQGGS